MVQRLDDTCHDDFPSASEATGVGLSTTDEVLILGQVGSFSACDVWMNLNPNWLNRVTLKVYARLGLARVLMRTVPLTTVPVTPSGDTVAGIAVSLRGHPCRAYEVTVQATAGAALDGGSFYLQAWHAGGVVAASGGEGAAPRAEVSAQLQGREPLTGAAVDVLVDDEGRMLIENPLLADDYIRLPEVASVPGVGTDEARFYYEDGVLTNVAPGGALRTEYAGSSGVRLRSVAAPIETQPTDNPSGVGYGASFAGGKSAAGFAGGTTTIGADNGGTPGTDLAGDVIVQLGTERTTDGQTAKLLLKKGSVELMRTSYATAGHVTQYVPGGWLTLQGYGGVMIWCAYNPVEVISAFNHTLIGSGGIQPIYMKPAEGTQVRFIDNTYEGRVAVTPSSTPSIVAGPSCTSFLLSQTKRSGSGANAGTPLTVKSQDGQDVASGTNNTGGELRLESGGKGANGTAGVDGAVKIRTGATDRITVLGDGSQIKLATDTSGSIIATNGAADPSITLTPSITPSIKGGQTCTSLLVSHDQRSGNGANAGAPLTVKAQDGQNVASGTNNTGGELRIESGGKGTGGTAGVDGAVKIRTGATDRIVIAGSGADIKLVTTRGFTKGTVGLEEDFYSDLVATSPTTEAEAIALVSKNRTLIRRYLKTTAITTVPGYTDTNVPTNSAILYRFTVLARCTSGTDAGGCSLVARQALVDRDTGNPTIDSVYTGVANQRSQPDSNLVSAALIGVSGANVVLNLTPRNTGTWHFTIWGERIVLTP